MNNANSIIENQTARVVSERILEMNQRFTLNQMLPYVALLLLISIFAVLVVQQVNPLSITLFSDTGAGEGRRQAFDYEQAADVSAARWQAMARFYEQAGLLTKDNFDYAQAAENMAIRWVAMAEAYERMGLLNEEMDPGEIMGYRWLAMARAYEKWGMLNDN